MRYRWLEVAVSKKKRFFLRLNGCFLVLKLEFALFYLDIEQYFLLLVPTSHLHTLRQKFPRQSQPPIRNRAGLGVISGEIADQSVLQGCGFESGTREARVPKPRIPA